MRETEQLSADGREDREIDRERERERLRPFGFVFSLKLERRGCRTRAE